MCPATHIFRWDKRSRAFVVDNLFSIECAELDDLVAVLEVKWTISSAQSARNWMIWWLFYTVEAKWTICSA